jgi:hypothetical protein
MSYAICSYNKTYRRHIWVAVVKQRVQNGPLHPMSRAKTKWQGNGEDATKNLKTVTCHYCDKMGHMKKHCRKRLAD